MNGLANTYAGRQQMKTVTQIASPVASRCTLPNSKLVISFPVGMRCIGGSLTTSDRNALPTIFSDKENSGFLDAILTCSSPDELKSLCEQRTLLESTRLQNYETYMIITGLNPYESRNERTSRLSHEKRTEYDRLREARNTLLNEGPHNSKNDGKEWRYKEFKKISRQLYELTGHHGYNYGKHTEAT